MNYPLIISNGHYIATIDGKNFVLDTGSPISISVAPEVSAVAVEGSRHELLCVPMFRTVLFDLTRMQVDGLIGLNIMEAHGYVSINTNDHCVCFANEPLEGNEISFRKCGTRLVMNAEVCGRSEPVILDTGACRGYIDPELIDALPTVGTVHDSNPDIGTINTPEKIAAIRLGGKDYSVHVGVSTAAVKLLYMCPASGILNITPFMQKQAKLDFRAGKLILA